MTSKRNRNDFEAKVQLDLIASWINQCPKDSILYEWFVFSQKVLMASPCPLPVRIKSVIDGNNTFLQFMVFEEGYFIQWHENHVPVNTRGGWLDLNSGRYCIIPLPKMFNLGERVAHPVDQKYTLVPNQATVDQVKSFVNQQDDKHQWWVSDKQNGSFGAVSLYPGFIYNDEASLEEMKKALLVTSKTALFHSELIPTSNQYAHAEIIHQLLLKSLETNVMKYRKLISFLVDCTCHFELLDPEWDPHILPQSEKKLVLLGARWHHSPYAPRSTPELQELANVLQMEMTWTEQMESVESLEILMQSLSETGQVQGRSSEGLIISCFVEKSPLPIIQFKHKVMQLHSKTPSHLIPEHYGLRRHVREQLRRIHAKQPPCHYRHCKEIEKYNGSILSFVAKMTMLCYCDNPYENPLELQLRNAWRLMSCRREGFVSLNLINGFFDYLNELQINRKQKHCFIMTEKEKFPILNQILNGYKVAFVDDASDVFVQVMAVVHSLEWNDVVVSFVSDKTEFIRWLKWLDSCSILVLNGNQEKIPQTQIVRNENELIKRLNGLKICGTGNEHLNVTLPIQPDMTKIFYAVQVEKERVISMLSEDLNSLPLLHLQDSFHVTLSYLEPNLFHLFILHSQIVKCEFRVDALYGDHQCLGLHLILEQWQVDVTLVPKDILIGIQYPVDENDENVLQQWWSHWMAPLHVTVAVAKDIPPLYTRRLLMRLLQKNAPQNAWYKSCNKVILPILPGV